MSVRIVFVVTVNVCVPNSKSNSNGIGNGIGIGIGIGMGMGGHTPRLHTRGLARRAVALRPPGRSGE
jgi:hypothetical protein